MARQGGVRVGRIRTGQGCVPKGEQLVRPGREVKALQKGEACPVGGNVCPQAAALSAGQTLKWSDGKEQGDEEQDSWRRRCVVTRVEEAAVLTMRLSVRGP